MFTTTKKYREFFPTLFVKTTDFQLVFNFEQTRTVTISGEHGRMALIKIPKRLCSISNTMQKLKLPPISAVSYRVVRQYNIHENT